MITAHVDADDAERVTRAPALAHAARAADPASPLAAAVGWAVLHDLDAAQARGVAARNDAFAVARRLAQSDRGIGPVPDCP